MVAAATISSSLMNIGLNYILIGKLGMAGAAIATVLSHSLQFLLHYLYTRYHLGKDRYPFPIGLWGPYGAVFLVFVGLVYLLPEAALVRWGIGAAMGAWELWRIRRRKVLI